MRRENGFSKKGIGLLWTEPWDGESSVEIAKLDPYFIEVCRRIRLDYTENLHNVYVLKKITKGPRVKAAHLKGILGDPWTPVDVKEKKSFTASLAGFPYRKVHQLMFSDDYTPGLTQMVSMADDKELLFIGQVLTRGQGKTEGYHERYIPVPGYACQMLLNPEKKDALFRRSERRIEAVSTLQRKVLKPALCALLQGGPPGKLKLNDDRVYPLLRRMDHDVDQMYFEHLWETLDDDEPTAFRSWLQAVADCAREHLEHAIGSCAFSTVARYRAIAMAERRFNSGMYHNFPEFRQEADSGEEQQQAEAV